MWISSRFHVSVVLFSGMWISSLFHVSVVLFSGMWISSFTVLIMERGGGPQMPKASDVRV